MNKHLTLQELKALNKVPIWVEDTEYPKNSGWHIIEWNNGKYLCLIGLSSKGYTVEEYGETWFAYLSKSVELWNSATMAPPEYKEYLVCTIYPTGGGGFQTGYVVIQYKEDKWDTDEIVVAWRDFDRFNLPYQFPKGV